MLKKVVEFFFPESVLHVDIRNVPSVGNLRVGGAAVQTPTRLVTRTFLRHRTELQRDEFGAQCWIPLVELVSESVLQTDAVVPNEVSLRLGKATIPDSLARLFARPLFATEYGPHRF